MAAGAPSSNVYTVLMFIAFVALTTAAVFLFLQSKELFPNLDSPFAMPDAQRVSMIDPVGPVDLV